MNVLDQHFTPPVLAGELVRGVTLSRVGQVGDFAAGDGALLEAAVERWPRARVVAADIDGRVVRGLERRHPAWEVSRCDFTSSRSRGAARALRRREGTFDVVVLNPPFSFRGGTKRAAVVGERTVEGSPPLAFVANALRYVRAGGQAVAILPFGALTSEKDREARAAIAEVWGLEVLHTYERGAFATCTPRTALVRIGGAPGASLSALTDHRVPVLRGGALPRVSVVRGRVQMGRALAAGPTHGLLHTTELREGQALAPPRKAPAGCPKVVGPAVLLPRVGKPSPSKVVVYPASAGPVVLSDCVLAIECSTEAAATRVQQGLVRGWDAVEAAYGGTCARYMTVSTLTDLLCSLGLDVLPYKESIRCNHTLSSPSHSSGDGTLGGVPVLRGRDPEHSPPQHNA